MTNRSPAILFARRIASLVTVPLLAAAALVALADEGPPPARRAATPPGMVHWASITAPEVASTPELVARGARRYDQRCSACHGAKGDGQGPAALFLQTAPRDFTRLIFKFRTTLGFPADLDLYRSVRSGFPAHGMPSFDFLSSEETWALVHRVKHLARSGWMARMERRSGATFDRAAALALVEKKMTPGEAVVVGPEPPEDDGPAEEIVARGRALYVANCQKCHGETGRGDGPSAPTLEDEWGHAILPRDFGESPAYRKAGWRRADTARIVRAGIGGTPMPAHPQLSDRDLWDLARYVEELARLSRE